MPLKLIPPVEGRWKNYRVRGTHRKVYVDRTTGTAEKRLAKRYLDKIEREIERGEFSAAAPLTFAAAVLAYLNAGGEDRFLKPIVDHFGPGKAIAEIDQAAIDACAVALKPAATPATRNRQVYTPIVAVLRHAGVERVVRRPKGAQGARRLRWLWPEEAARLIEAAGKVDREFGLFLTVLLYTGMRLSDALGLRCSSVRLSESFAFLPTTKNEEPRPVHLPPPAVAALASLPRGLARADATVFRFRKNGHLYNLMKATKKRAGADLSWVTFHSLCHTWATWMRRYGGLDTTGLVATGRWKDRKSAAIYEHAVVSEEARKADSLPALKGNYILDSLGCEP